MMLVLMPMWLLSGAFFPLSGGPTWLAWTMRANPLTYGVALFRHALYGDAAATGALPSAALSLGVTIAFAAAAFGVALFLVGRRTQKNLS
jgi:ABC-2 type transport system permease protein